MYTILRMYYCIIGSGAVIRNSESNFNCTLYKMYGFFVLYISTTILTRRRVDRQHIFDYSVLRFSIPIAVVIVDAI